MTTLGRNCQTKVQDYATRWRLETNYADNKGDPMDIAAVNKSWDNQGDWSEEWGNDWNEGGGGGNIDALGKSKSKGFKGKGQGDNKGNGKGKLAVFSGQYSSRGEYGDSAKFSPYGIANPKEKEQSQ